MVIFNSYVSLPEAILHFQTHPQMVGDAIFFHHGHRVTPCNLRVASKHGFGTSPREIGRDATERGQVRQRGADGDHSKKHMGYQLPKDTQIGCNECDMMGYITCHQWTMVLLESIKHNSEFRFSDSSIPSSWYAKWAAMDKGDYGKELWAHEKLRHIPSLVGWTLISSSLRILDGEIAMFVGSNMKNLAGHQKFLDWVRPSTSPGPGECPWLQEVG